MLRRNIAGAGIAVALAITAPPAIAADKTPVPVETEAPYISPMRPSCYVQGLGGAGINGAKATDGSGYIESISASGWTIAAGIGCDIKVGRVVVGALGRYEIPVQQDKDLFQVKGSWLAAARAGYLINTGLLAYGLVGFSGSSWSATEFKQEAKGLVLGGGIEVMLAAQVSLTAEYTNTQYGKWTEGDIKISPEGHAMRLGLSYRFGTLFGE
jgi:opacity protein-like surface antigen